jgi:hypothetical protein
MGLNIYLLVINYMKLNLKPIDYVGIVLEALPCGIPLAMDYKMRKVIETDTRNLLDNPENTKELAMTTKQQLNLDPQYRTFRYFDGILTRRAKQSVKSVLDKLEEKKRSELLNKKYSTLAKGTATSSEDLHIRVILPEEITQE